jgi:tRNA 2-thiocytidine biosynthesis protein TtcA
MSALRRFRVNPDVADGTLHDFRGLTATGVANAGGDKAFDVEDFPPAAWLGLQVIKR